MVDDFFLDGKHSDLRAVQKILKNLGKKPTDGKIECLNFSVSPATSSKKQFLNTFLIEFW